MGSFFKNALLVFASFVFTLVLCEIFLRFLPVNDGFNFQPVNAEQSIYHAMPHQQVTVSSGWALKNSRELRVNNVGFRNDQNYTTDRNNPLIAVIGDSYVEAIQVDYPDTFYGRLSNDMKDHATVYSFGFAGAPLSQYLVWAKHAVDHYGANHLTFNIVSNDFDESLAKYQQRQGFHQYEECVSESLCNQRTDYEIGNFRPIITSSALLRYLFFNVHITELIKNYRSPSEPTRYVANVLEAVDEEVITDSKLAIDLFFRDLPTKINITKENIVFLIDGRNYELSDSRFASSFFGQMRTYFIQSSDSNGYQTIDLKKHYDDHFIANGKHFESATDAHWNELGHEIAAQQLRDLYLSRLPL